MKIRKKKRKSVPLKHVEYHNKREKGEGRRLEVTGANKNKHVNREAKGPVPATGEDEPLGVVSFESDLSLGEQVKAAIIALNEQAGSTRQSVMKYVFANFGTDKFGVPGALQQGVSKGELRQQRQNFFVRGHKVTKVEKKDPAKQLLMVDEKVGDGSEAVKGSTVSVEYVGTLVGGVEFDQGSVTFTLGEGEVIKGWDRGIKGMKVNGTRKLVIGSVLGYGKEGSLPEIPSNATLFFTVKLVEVV
jgi:hypothetical protein